MFLASNKLLFFRDIRIMFLLTHIKPVFHFYTPWKHQNVFRGYRNGILAWDGLFTQQNVSLRIACGRGGEPNTINNELHRIYFWRNEFTSNLPTEVNFVFNFPANIYLFKVNNCDTRKRCEICSKLTIKTLEQLHCCRSGIFIVKFKHISHFL